MAKILIGIPLYKAHPFFLESLPKFYAKIALSHSIDLKIVSNTSLVTAQNIIAETFLKSDKEYLLFLEDDHWGHTPEMLEDLLKANTEIVAINYYSRYFPFMHCCMIDSGYKEEDKQYTQYPEDTTGHKECKLIPFGMTLIRRDTFNYLDRPYFRLNSSSSVATDKNF